MSFCVLVSGGTNFTDFEFLRLDLDGYLKDKGVTPILSGCARGAERLAIRYAEAWGSPVLRFPGPWQETSAAAPGPVPPHAGQVGCGCTILGWQGPMDRLAGK